MIFERLGIVFGIKKDVFFKVTKTSLRMARATDTCERISAKADGWADWYHRHKSYARTLPDELRNLAEAVPIKAFQTGDARTDTLVSLSAKLGDPKDAAKANSVRGLLSDPNDALLECDSVFLCCSNCNMFGTPFPDDTICGNCGSDNTVMVGSPEDFH